MTEGGTTISSFYNYEWWDRAKEKDITANPYNPNAPSWLAGYSHFQYDVNGHLTQLDDPRGGKAVRFTNDAQGQILVRDELSGGVADAQGKVTGAATVNKHHSFYYFNGHRIGDVGNDGPLKVSYAEDLARSQNPARSDGFKNFQPIASADFDQNYQPINSAYPAATSIPYTVRLGDTLQSIASAFWGDATMWYLIAEVNGLTGSETLRAGQVLTIPNKVTNLHNTSATYQPYNAGEAIGDTSPTLPTAPPPPPMAMPGEPCGGFGEILVFIVVIVVAYFTGQYVGGVLAPVIGEAAAVAVGTVVGAAVGNAAGQGVAIAIGLQDGFSWRSVALAAVTAGIVPGGAAGSIGDAIVQGAVRSLVTQGVSVALGLQDRFDWKQVAISAVSGGVGYAANQLIGGWQYSDWDALEATSSPSELIARQQGYALVRGIGSGIAAGAASVALRGGSVRNNLGAIAAEATGSTIGYMIAGNIAAGDARRGSAVENDPRTSDPMLSSPGSAGDNDAFTRDMAQRQTEYQWFMDAANGNNGAISPDASSKPTSYTARSGDTVWKLMEGNKERIGEFRRLNNLKDADKIYADQDYLMPVEGGFDTDMARASFDQQAALWNAKAIAARQAALAQQTSNQLMPGLEILAAVDQPDSYLMQGNRVMNSSSMAGSIKESPPPSWTTDVGNIWNNPYLGPIDKFRRAVLVTGEYALKNAAEFDEATSIALGDGDIRISLGFGAVTKVVGKLPALADKLAVGANKGKYAVGPYNEIKGTVAGMDAHHVGQQALMKEIIPGYEAAAAPAILVPKVGHTIRGPNGIVSRITDGLSAPRDVLARDINELRRVYPDIPNSQLQSLIRMNKEAYPAAFAK